MSSYIMEVRVAKLIWEIARKSPAHGNAVMDVIGENAYRNVMELQKEDLSDIDG